MAPIDENLDVLLDKLFSSKMNDDKKKQILKEILECMVALYDSSSKEKQVNAMIEKKYIPIVKN